MIQPTGHDRFRGASGASISAPTLRRARGRWDLTTIGANQVIGGAIFLLPSRAAAQIGALSPIGMILKYASSSSLNGLVAGIPCHSAMH